MTDEQIERAARCSTCKHWLEPRTDFTGKTTERRYGNDERDIVPASAFKNPPHANLAWGHCDAAPEGWDDDIDRSEIKMAVWDGSEYEAQLLTRADHICGEWAALAAAEEG